MRAKAAKMLTSTQLADQLFPDRRLEDDFEILDIPPEQRRLHTETYDFTVSTIIDYLRNGHIYIPRFQRSYVWTRAQASRLIESLVIQCPIPVIYLNQDRDERLAVIDGNQRLQSIKLYIENAFPLRGLTTYPELEGLSFDKLDPRIQRHILNRTLRCIAILKDTHAQIKFDVFERLNTGATQLSAQELRHGVYHGPLIEMIDKAAQNQVWSNVYGARKDHRMKGAELVLRFIALNRDLARYQKPLSGFLNAFCERNRNADDRTLESWNSEFIETAKKVASLLGKHAFRIIDERGEPNQNINAALFDAQMVGIARFKGNLPSLPEPELIVKLRALYDEPAFKEAITSGTSATNLVKLRITRFSKFLESSGK